MDLTKHTRRKCGGVFSSGSFCSIATAELFSASTSPLDEGRMHRPATLDLSFHYGRQCFFQHGFCPYSHVELQPCSSGLSAASSIFWRTVSSGQGCCREVKWKVYLQGCRLPAFHMQSMSKRLWCKLKLACRDLYGNWVASHAQKGISSFSVNALPVWYHTAESVF